MLIPVMRPRQYDATLVPNDLLRIQESDSLQAVQNFAGKYRCMPYIRNLQTRYEFEGFGPVGPRIPGDSRFSVALGPVFHVAGLGGPAPVESGPVAPFRVQFNPVRRIGNHE